MLEDYGDCDIFKPGELWESPRGNKYRVIETRIGGRAKLRNGGKNTYRAWDGVMNWVRHESAPSS